ncbi:MAG: dephospho-CoA kinase [Candidatus Omnitrophota bacterium]
MTVIGLTGGFGSGKTTVAEMLADLGARVIDADRVVSDLFEQQEIRARIQEAFPTAVTDKGMNRSALAGIVFHDPQKLDRLEGIIHPAVRQEMRGRITRWSDEGFDGVVVLDVPLLFEAGMEDMVDVTIVVRADQEQQIERVLAREDITRDDVLRRIKRQMPLEEKIQRADFVVDNRHSRQETREQVLTIWKPLVQA